MSYATARNRKTNGDLNRLYAEDQPFHCWYRFVLSYPPHLVRDYVGRFGLDRSHTVLDPFCGTGTTLVECKRLGLSNIGIEGTPIAHFASAVKTDWSPSPDELLAHAQSVANAVEAELREAGISDEPVASATVLSLDSLLTLAPEGAKLLLKDSISARPLHKTLMLLDCLGRNRDPRFYDHERLALAKALVTSISNLHFGPEVGVGPAKEDTAVIAPWLGEIRRMAEDLRSVPPDLAAQTTVYRADARQAADLLEPESVDAVITSPPYPNEKDYTRVMRLESVVLGFIRDRAELRALKRRLVRSNTRGVYKGDDDDQWVEDNFEVQRIAREIEERRVELGKTSGFERMYPRVTKLYFGGMARHLAELRPALRPGARLAYVVGDQASYLRVMIRTGQILGAIAETLGYELETIDLFRTRLATATREQLREEVVVLRWPGR